jgi:hypothetical protein
MFLTIWFMLPNIIKIKIVREFLYCLAELHDVEHTIYCDILFTSTQQEQVLANRAKEHDLFAHENKGMFPFLQRLASLVQDH